MTAILLKRKTSEDATLSYANAKAARNLDCHLKNVIKVMISMKPIRKVGSWSHAQEIP